MFDGDGNSSLHTVAKQPLPPDHLQRLAQHPIHLHLHEVNAAALRGTPPPHLVVSGVICLIGDREHPSTSNTSSRILARAGVLNASNVSSVNGFG